ncbi:histidine phosphatase family protein [Sutcliffiella rhizosphaerae]|uniref:Histidine phosphatase family protein n=1 Tax=Sutcliffiella rhizosphaerae TaxID=2880967 RepID=A0ABN8AC84_9BACI|nr:histidine phosphatase family protein [Sutcliffiella rhizosphaerae]CAG9621297.1 hypothetical protein BACCIP111883_02069 [Sutcliffiella rhizosphaerae]
MDTYIYMVRHGESPKEGDERTRGLTAKGYEDALLIGELLRNEEIDVVLSSPYKRSILSVQPIAKQIGQEVIVIDNLKERMFTGENNRMSDKELLPLLKKSFEDPYFSLSGAESNTDCQKRAVKVLQEILNVYKGRRVVVGTHGAIMTLMMGFYSPDYSLDFLLQTTKPDIYRMQFNVQQLVEVKKLWKE